jgi:hypothetical protein
MTPGQLREAREEAIRLIDAYPLHPMVAEAIGMKTAVGMNLNNRASDLEKVLDVLGPMLVDDEDLAEIRQIVQRCRKAKDGMAEAAEALVNGPSDLETLSKANSTILKALSEMASGENAMRKAFAAFEKVKKNQTSSNVPIKTLHTNFHVK